MLHRLKKSRVLESYEYHLLSSLQLRESSHGSPVEINGSYLKPWIGMRFSYAQKPKPGNGKKKKSSVKQERY
jgi:hypothetical protein